MKKSDTSATPASQLSGAKGSTEGVQVANSSMEEMLAQLHQILAQITQSMDNDSPANAADSEGNKQMLELANQLAANLQEQDKDAGESAMQAVLDIIDALADMLDNGQIAMSKDAAA